MNENFFKNKNVLIIGHKCYIGSWLTILMLNLGAKVMGYSKNQIKDPSSSSIDLFKECSLWKKVSNINDDLNNINHLYSILETNPPDIVLYLVNPAISSEVAEKPLGPYINTLSNTLNFLQCIKNCPLKLCTIVVVSDEDPCGDAGESGQHGNTSDFQFTDLSIKALNSYLKIGTSCQILVNAYKKSFFSAENYKQHLKSITTIKDKILYLDNKLDDSTSIHNISIENILKSITTYSILIEGIYNAPDEYSNSYNTDDLSNVSRLISLSAMSNPLDSRALIKNIDYLNNELFSKETTFTTYWEDNYGKLDTYELCSNIIKVFLKTF